MSNMRKLRNGIGLLLGMTLVILPACKKADTTAPSTTVSAPGDLSHYQSGEKIPVRASFTDNQSLLQYSILVTSIDHTDIMDSLDLMPFFGFGKTWGLDGSGDGIADQTVAVPVAVASGNYEVTVWCVDEQGNESPRVKVKIYIQNSGDENDPTLTVNSLDESQVNNVSFGQAITLDADVTDDLKLGALYINLVREATGDVEQNYPIELTGTSQHILTNITAPKFLGKYKLTVSASDYVNNRDTRVFNIEVN